MRNKIEKLIFLVLCVCFLSGCSVKENSNINDGRGDVSGQKGKEIAINIIRDFDVSGDD